MLPVPSCGEMISRPFGSIAMHTQDPSPRSDDRRSSTLNPGNPVNFSAAVATGAAITSPHGCTPSLPRLTAFSHGSPLNAALCHPSTSVREATHEESVTTDSLLSLTVNSSFAMTPASLLLFRP